MATRSPSRYRLSLIRFLLKVFLFSRWTLSMLCHAADRSSLRLCWNKSFHSHSSNSIIGGSSLYLASTPNSNLNGVVFVLRLGVTLKHFWQWLKYLYHSSVFGADNLVNNDINVRFILSTWPLARGTPVVVNTCCVRFYNSLQRQPTWKRYLCLI